MKSKRARSKDPSEPSRQPKRPASGVSNNDGQTEIGVTSLKPHIPFRLLQLSKHLQLGKARDKNFVFSPCSIQLALSLVAHGSTGATLKELLAFLEVKDLDHLTAVATALIDFLIGSTSGGINLSFVGGLWIDHSLTLCPKFKDKAERIYHANSRTVDFRNKGGALVDEVNRWAEEATNGFIKSFLRRPLNQGVVLLLANALYFKGLWNDPFKKGDTWKSTFYLLDGSSVHVPFMHSRENQYVTEFDDLKVLRLPYRCGAHAKVAISMYILLPNEQDGLRSLIEKVGSDRSFLERCVSSVRCKISVRLFKIPKFAMTFEFEASDVLKNTGLKLPFSDIAELDDMVLGAGPRLKVSEINHKSNIIVNEKGTEAAAVTGVAAQKVGLMVSKYRIDFVADHPFMFLLRDDVSGMVLFMGHVINPLA